MNFEIVDKKIEEIEADIELIFVVDKEFEHRWVKDTTALEFVNFKGEAEESCFLSEAKKLYIGVSDLEADDIAEGCSKAYKLLKKTSAKSLKMGLYLGDGCLRRNLRAQVEGFILGSYVFDRYKSTKSEGGIEKVKFAKESYNSDNLSELDLQKAIDSATIVSEAVNFARDIVNTPPKDAKPIDLEMIAKEMAKEENLEFVSLNQQQIKDMGMGAFYAVSIASSEEPRLIHLSYKPESPKAKVALVGKGLTYDSGGLSLKPADYMTTMKADKSGGCAVLAIIKAAAKMKLPIEIEAVVGATENMIGGDAYKPDDVLIAKNGKSIEVKNTDAEGRLVLADCLCYAQQFNPDYILDMATLTGACIVALGEYTSGIMGFNDELKGKIIEAANLSGELASPLPFNKHLKKLLKSDIADMSNIGSSRYGGAITAGLFLSEFIEEDNMDKWVHIDIAGPAFVQKEWGVNPSGASGAGVRMVTKFLERLAVDFSCDSHKKDS